MSAPIRFRDPPSVPDFLASKPIMTRTLVALLALVLALVLPLSAAPLSGIKSVGPSAADYPSITAAIADIQTQSLGGPLVLELQAEYVGTAETFPLVVPSLIGASEANTLIIRPAAGAAALELSSANNTAATLDLNGARFVTIDGRPGGDGTTKQLTITNTSTSGVAVRFINEANHNALRHIALKGSNTNTGNGTVVFSTTTGANGNDDNLIDSCDLGDGAGTPKNAICSAGTTSGAAKANSGNIVSNCNILNFHGNPGTTGDSAGIRLMAGSSDWIISGNSFYQTAPHAAGSGNLRAIHIDNTSGNNFTISGNFIGGSAPHAEGAAWTTTATGSYLFQGISLNVGSLSPSKVSGNTVANIAWNTGSSANRLPGAWTGIFVENGAVEIDSGNSIGRDTGTGSILCTTGSGGTTFGIGSASSGRVTIAGNTVGSINTSHPTSGAASLVGIQVTAGDNDIANNLIGSTSTPNSLNATTSTSTPAIGVGQQVTGIAVQNSSSNTTITGNTVANLNNNHGSASPGWIRGIVTSSGVNTISGNTVRNLSTTSPLAGVTNPPSVIGISQTSTTAGQTVSLNVVHSLSNTAASAGVTIMGIHFKGNTTDGPNPIARNQVHSLAIASTSASSRLFGMYFEAGVFTARNNMVSVGLDAGGTTTAGSSFISGIYDLGGTGDRSFHHNSVHVGGTQISGTAPTAAFVSGGTTNTRDFRNNIFANTRGNGGAAGKHYAAVYNNGAAAPPNPAGLTSNCNLFFTGGSGGVLGLFNAADQTNLTAWQAATGQDASSAFADPRFVNPTGDANTIDLHLLAENPAQGGGLPIPSVTDDFDGETRGSLPYADIGADSSNQLAASDIYAPAISLPPLSHGSTANRTLTDCTIIGDNSGIVAGGADTPRLYYKKATDADTFGGNTAADDGWKYVTATRTGGSYGFTIDYSLLNGGGVGIGDTIQYFVVAQDASGNLSSYPAAATASANPPVRNIVAKPAAGVGSYMIAPTLGGTVTVGGSGSDYSSLTGAGGLFAALNSNVLASDITVKITGDTLEDGGTMLNATMQDAYPGTFSVTFQPDGTSMRTISGSGPDGMICLSGVRGVTIDGRSGGGGRHLTFRNTGSTGAAIAFINDASENTVRNCVIEGANTSVVLFGTGLATGNDSNLVTDNRIRNRGDVAASPPDYLVASIGTSDTVANSNNTVSNNELSDFENYGVITLSGSESWNISGNTIYQTAARTTFLAGIVFNAHGANEIRNNTIHDLTTAGQATGISVGGKRGSASITGNRIWKLGIVNGSASGATGISVNADGTGRSVVLANNMISVGHPGGTLRYIYGIRDLSLAAGTVIVAYNSVLISGFGGLSDSWSYNNLGNSNSTVRNNLFLNLSTGSRNNFAANCPPNSTGSLTMSHNIYSGTGRDNPGAFFDGSNGTGDGGLPISHAQWLANVPGDIHSSAGNPGGDFSGSMFVNPAEGDLHLIPGGNPLVNHTGTPIPELASDFDGQLRSASQPYIGADELAAPGNRPPLFPGHAVNTRINTAIDVFHTALLARASDPDGDALTIGAVSATSAAGGTVANGSGGFNYTPPAGHTGLDILDVTVTDGRGGETSGPVIVNVTDGDSSGGNSSGDGQSRLAFLRNGGRLALLFSGSPGEAYRIQRSTDLVDWQWIGSTTATGDGRIPFADPNPPAGSAFYRAIR